MSEVRFIDTTLRDGNQSIWGATAGMLLTFVRMVQEEA